LIQSRATGYSKMFDQLIYAAIAGTIVIAILALIKVMIDYPGMGDMCMRFIHKKTAGKSEAKKTGIEEVIVDDEKNIELEQESFDISLLKLPIEKVDPEGTSMSRISTDPEICKKRLQELDEILACPCEEHTKIAETQETDHAKRRASHDHHHHQRRHPEYHRRHSHDHHRHHHHHHHHNHHDHSRKASEAASRHHHHHHRHLHAHHSSTESDSSSPSQRKKHHRQHEIDDSREKISRNSPSSNLSLDAIKASKNGSGMRININNVNILINRHIQKDVTINIEMDEENESEIVEVVEELEHHEHHDHDHEVRSSDSGIGWDEHHVHDNIAHDHHENENAEQSHDITIPEIHVAPVEIEPIAEEDPSLEKAEMDDTTSSKKEEIPRSFFSKIDALPVKFPKRFRSNTYT